MFKALILKSILIATACGMSVCAFAESGQASKLNIPAGELAAALKVLAVQANVELVFQAERLRGFKTEGLVGSYSVAEAAEILLKGTELKLFTDRSGAMVIASSRANAETSLSRASS